MKLSAPAFLLTILEAWTGDGDRKTHDNKNKHEMMLMPTRYLSKSAERMETKNIVHI